MTARQQTTSGQWSAEQGAEEARIVLAARADLTRFAPVYERYAPRIYGYCLRRLQNRDEAEDLTSLVFTSALKALDSFRGGSVGAWLFRIAHNAVVTHVRGRRAQVSFDSLDDELMPEDDDLIQEVMQGEARRRVREFVGSLPDEQQELVALKVTAGLTAEEVGAVLGKSAGAVRVEYHRIVQRLRAHFDERGER